MRSGSTGAGPTAAPDRASRLPGFVAQREGLPRIAAKSNRRDRLVHRSCKPPCILGGAFCLHLAIFNARTPVPSARLPTVEHMFASVFSQLPARLRRALALMKAFACLEDAHRPLLTTVSDSPAAQPSSACAGDRRRGPGIARGPRPGSQVERCSTAGSSAGRCGRPPAPTQRCATPTVSGNRADAPAAPNNRRGAVPGGFLHR